MFTAAKPHWSSTPGLPMSDLHRKGFLASLPSSSRDSSSIPSALPVPTAPALLRTSMPTHQPTHRVDIGKDGDAFSASALTTAPLKFLRTPTPMPALSSQAQERSISQSIQVVCRFRPARVNDPFEWYNAMEDQAVVQVNISERALDFGFDRVFNSQATQADVYDSVRHVVLGLLDGFNGTLLCYGQTGSGKTHTMMGQPEVEMDMSFGNTNGSSLPVPPTNRTPRRDGVGVIPRAVDDLFAMVAEFQDTIEFTFKVSYVEVYCEKVRDLLNTETGGDLKLRDDPQGGVAVTGATEVFAATQAEILKVIEAGQLGRMTAATRMNEESSRSHALLLLTVTQKNTATNHVRRGRLTLVDLAGSERIAKTGASGLRLEEAKNINRSLTTLGMVISALADGRPHIPYRDAKLTRILAESLGGNSRTCLVVCCAPELSHSQESISTLRFGERAKKVKNHAVRNEEMSAYELQVLLTRALDEIEHLNVLLLPGGIGGDRLGRMEGKLVTVSDAAATDMAATTVAALVERHKEERGRASLSSPILAHVEGADSVDPHSCKVVDDCTYVATKPSASTMLREGSVASASLAQEEVGRAADMSSGSISTVCAYNDKDDCLSSMEVELGRLRALLKEKGDENAYLTLKNDELITRLAEEEAAVIRAMEEQSALESRLLEAEVSMNQMRRIMMETQQGPMRSNSVKEGGSGSLVTPILLQENRGRSAPSEEVTEGEEKKGNKGKPPSLLSLSAGMEASSSCNNNYVPPPMSPSLQEIYEEKLRSVERVSRGGIVCR